MRSVTRCAPVASSSERISLVARTRRPASGGLRTASMSCSSMTADRPHNRDLEVGTGARAARLGMAAARPLGYRNPPDASEGRARRNRPPILSERCCISRFQVRVSSSPVGNAPAAVSSTADRPPCLIGTWRRRTAGHVVSGTQTPGIRPWRLRPSYVGSRCRGHCNRARDEHCGLPRCGSRRSARNRPSMTAAARPL